MSSRAKRGASEASNILRRDAKLPGHLLSTFNKEKSSPKDEPSPKNDTDSSLSEIGVETEAELERGQTEEDDSIFAQPASSTDGENDDYDIESDIGRPRRSYNEPTERLEDKLAAGKASHNSGRQSMFPKKSLARTSSMMDDDEDDLKNFLFNSQSSKRSRTTFGSKKSQSFSRTPASSAMSIATPEKPSPKPKPAAKTNKSKNAKNNKKKKETKSSEESDPEDTFKVPLNIDVPSPVKKKSETNIASSPDFKVPLMFPDDEPSYNSSLGASQMKSFEISSQSSLSSISPPSSPSLDELQQLPVLDSDIQICSPPPPSPPRKSLCPNCKAEVDPELLKQFQAQPDQRLRQQQRFCASHKKDMATKEWKDQGYPEINWETLGDRLQTYFPELEKHFTSNEQSYFRNLLESAEKAGKPLRLTLEGDGIEAISCGYYGTKGAQKM